MQIEIGQLDRLEEDVEYCIEQHEKLDNKQFWRRALVRAFFGLVECLVFVARRHFLLHRASIVKKSLFSKPEWLENIKRLLQATELSETELTDQGKAKTRFKKHRSLPLLKATVRLFFYIFKHQESEAEQLFQSEDWMSLEQSIIIRDRLMHPKEYKDVNVSDDEHKQVLRAYRAILMLSASGLEIAIATFDGESNGQSDSQLQSDDCRAPDVTQ